MSNKLGGGGITTASRVLIAGDQCYGGLDYEIRAHSKNEVGEGILICVSRNPITAMKNVSGIKTSVLKVLLLFSSLLSLFLLLLLET